jgi:16S rRNA (guanine527-N7)-methyltransferase
MTDDKAQAWLEQNYDVSRETMAQLQTLVDAVIDENSRQNLISAASEAEIWHRHVVDSAQLLAFFGDSPSDAPWIDLGTGAGFPGLVIAILVNRPIILVESRRKRFEFLERTAQALGLSHVTVHGGSLDSLDTVAASVISARAFAPLPRLLDAAIRFSRKKTLWLLPKGRSAAQELASIESTWHGDFSIKQSVTDAQSAIIVASGVHKRK